MFDNVTDHKTKDIKYILNKLKLVDLIMFSI